MSIVTTTTMQQCQELIDKVREFWYLKIMERQINKFNRLLQKQEGNITYAGNPPNPHPGRSIGSAQSPQSGQNLSPQNGTPVATALDNCHNSQPGDVAGKARDQGVGPGETAASMDLTTTAPDNVSSDAGDQGLRPRSTMEMPKLLPQPGAPHPQPGPSRV